MYNQPEIINPIPRTAEISWEAYEHKHHHVTNDWFWTVALLGFVTSLVSIYYSNYLLAIFAIVSSFTIIMLKIKGPQILTIRLTPKGIIVKDSLYPYNRIESFCIYEQGCHGIKRTNELSIKSDRTFMPQIILPLGEIETDLVRNYLSRYLIEEHHEIQIADVLSEFLKF